MMKQIKKWLKNKLNKKRTGLIQKNFIHKKTKKLFE